MGFNPSEENRKLREAASSEIAFGDTDNFETGK